MKVDGFMKHNWLIADSMWLPWTGRWSVQYAKFTLWLVGAHQPPSSGLPLALTAMPLNGTRTEQGIVVPNSFWQQSHSFRKKKKKKLYRFSLSTVVNDFFHTLFLLSSCPDLYVCMYAWCRVWKSEGEGERGRAWISFLTAGWMPLDDNRMNLEIVLGHVAKDLLGTWFDNSTLEFNIFMFIGKAMSEGI